MKIKEIKELLVQDHIDSDLLKELKLDERAGVKKLLASYERKQEKLAKKK